MFASSHSVAVTAPARNDDLAGYHIILVPAPDVANAEPEPKVPVEIIPSVPFIVNAPASATIVFPAPAPP